MVEPESALVIVVRQQFCRGIQRWTDIRERNQLFCIQRYRIQQKRRNLPQHAVVAERLTREFVNERHGISITIRQSREIPRALGRRWHNCRPCFALARSLPFVKSEEEILVMTN